MIFTLVPNACKIPCILPLVTDDTTALTANQKTKRKQIQSDSSLVWGFPHPQLSVPPVSSRPYSCNQFCVTVAPTFTAVFGSLSNLGTLVVKMTEADPQTQTLIQAQSQETAINVGAPEHSGRSTRAYKVAGVTLLACTLILSQALLAYFLLSQKDDIKSLKDQNNKLSVELSKPRSAGPGTMQIPKSMNILPTLLETSGDEEDSTGGPVKPGPLTQCQQEAAGLKPVQVPGFYPNCDEQGLYQSQQCYMEQCWCVDPASGQQIPGTLGTGPVMCTTAVHAGGMERLLSVPDVTE